ncbi:MAG: VacJ family lipoprotein [Rhodobacteraceae bacterium]|nr:VacJ family lipoprotein [Paracoccaceae bacterium]
MARLTAGAALLAALAACATPGDTVARDSGINDPYEQHNRAIHEANKGLDRIIVRPLARGYTAIAPDEIEDSIANVAENLGMPQVAVNGLLQGNVETVTMATTRFLVNSVLGFGGLFDVASDFGVPEADSDFGETLYVWGVPEGAYLEVPVLGPSTVRRLAGRIVDLFLDPLDHRLPSPEDSVDTVTGIAARLSDRGKFAGTVDSVLYESADSYAQARLIYLQSRRFKLSGGAGRADTTDPYDDPYADAYEDPYAE